jgi:signal transduction histidine kinase/HD-like signal output (HDOD) protein
MVKELPQIVNKINTAIPLPSLPQLLFKLIEVCRDDSSSVEDIVRIALLDPAITVKLMRLSANWMPEVTGVRSIEKVIANLGAGNMRKLALVALATPIINNALRHSAVKLNQFWRHSIQCAFLARKLAERQGHGSPGDAYLAGLLHDIGQLLLWTHFKKEFDPIFQERPTAATSTERENSRIGTNHCEAGWRLAREVRLQPFVADAILYHHRPPMEIAHAMPLVRIVYAANMLCYRQQDRFSMAEMMQSVGLKQTPSQIESLAAETKRTLETVSRYLGIRPEVVAGSEFSESSESFLPIYEFLREFRELSLVHIASGEIDAENGRETAQRELCLTLQILFDILPVCFLYYNPERNTLTGKSTPDYTADMFVDGIEMPVKPGASLAAAAAIRSEIVDSFGYLAGEMSSIADEQLLRLLGTEGMVCIPLKRRGKVIGIIIGGINESQFPVLSEQIALLRQFADRAAIVLEGKSDFDGDRRLVSAESDLARDAVRRVIHEVNNPLGIIKNYLNILGPKVRDIGRGQEEIDLIREEIDRIPGIIQQLSASKESGAAAAEIIDINNILSDLSKLLKKSVLEPSAISLHFAPDPQLPSLPANRGNLVQVFTNLLKNSIEAMPEGGNIFIQTAFRKKTRENGQGNILIEIRDDGPGIPDSVMQQLFEPGNSSKGPENFGLGLSISREIIQRYNGDIQCQTKVNEGTTFQIALPCSADKDGNEREKSI